MKTLRERYGHSAFLQLPQISSDQVQLLWVNGWYDGPIDGVALYQGEMYYFQLVNDQVIHDDCLYRVYILIQLTAEQMHDEAYWHGLFREKVGTHWDFREDDRPYGVRFVKPAETHHEFYASYKKRTEPDFSQNKIKGWFERAMMSLADNDEDEDA